MAGELDPHLAAFIEALARAHARRDHELATRRMTMADEYVEDLKKLRSRLTEARRKMTASMIKGPHLVTKEIDVFMNTQQHIEAVDRAIEDEQKAAPSSYETRGLREL
jgi:hypothetical protein